jgi:hypothetical protein
MLTCGVAPLDGCAAAIGQQSCRRLPSSVLRSSLGATFVVRGFAASLSPAPLRFGGVPRAAVAVRGDGGALQER